MMKFGINKKIRSEGGTGMNFCRWTGTKKKYPKLNRDKKVSFLLKDGSTFSDFNSDKKDLPY